MKKLTSTFGYLLIFFGLAIVVFIVIIFSTQFALVELLPLAQEYALGILLGLIFIAIGILILKDNVGKIENIQFFNFSFLKENFVLGLEGSQQEP
jgi:hypothetical protein